ncbi:hypothetical protein AB1Y20_007468 [Prymnesium parvum]|uniref:Methyltransferase FkbM domain-containing protein n=1 Tax=Prymnesium parvum TaxID=97485 RepID=A0AB34IYP6_PRYPA
MFVVALWGGAAAWWLDPKYHLEQKPQLADALAFAAPTCPKGLVIDVGANGGKETSAARAKGYRVLAVECLVPEYLRLQAQWLHDPMITLLSGCASDAVGLHRFHHASAGSSLHKAAVSGDAEARMHAKARSLVTNVPSFPLDPMLESGPLSAEPLCVLKVDVQGHEIFVLRGVARSIRKHRPVVIFEYDPRFGPQARGASARVDHLRGNWIRLLTLPVVAWVARPGERNDSFMRSLQYDCAVPTPGKGPGRHCSVCNVLCMPNAAMWAGRHQLARLQETCCTRLADPHRPHEVHLHALPRYVISLSQCLLSSCFRLRSHMRTFRMHSRFQAVRLVRRPLPPFRMPLTLGQLEDIRADALADDMEIDLEKMARWTAAEAAEYFESGGEWEPDSGLVALLASMNLEGLRGHFVKETLSGLSHMERTPLLDHLKSLGVSSLPERQQIAQGVAKAARGELEGLPTGEKDEAKPTAGEAERTSFDCVIAGGGACGCAFARDMAENGYSSLILESEEAIGGTWRRHNYPGLKLHQTGEQYRCMSIPPPWTLVHAASEGYRPYRQEILDYVHMMADHPLISVRTGTKFLGESPPDEAGVRTVRASNGKEYKARFVLIALGVSYSGTGPGRVPEAIKSMVHGPNSPGCVHSSACSPEVWEKAKAAGTLVILGAGKAACDILNFGCDPSWKNVVWVHRGMHIFLNRKLTTGKAVADEGAGMMVVLNQLQQAARGTNKTWEELGLDKTVELDGEQVPVMIKAKGRLTRRTHKSGSGIWQESERDHVNKYERQMLMERMESGADGSLILTSEPKEDGTRDTLTLGKGDWLVYATGQANEAADGTLTWPPPRYEKGLAVAHQHSPTGILNALPMVGFALDCLEDKLDPKRLQMLSERAKEYNEFKSPEKVRTFLYEKRGIEFDYRGYDGQMMNFMRDLNCHALLTGCRSWYKDAQGQDQAFSIDMMYKKEWFTTWYGKPVGVREVLETLGWNKFGTYPE